MDATTGRRDRSFADRAAAGIASAVLVAVGAAADPEIPPSLAAPGDCAQPIRDLDTGPVHEALPASASRGVAGLPALHFAPIAAPDDSPGLLPLDLTRAAQTVDVSGEWVGDVGETAGGALGDLGATSGGALGDVGSAVDPLVDATVDTLGSTTEKLLR